MSERTRTHPPAGIAERAGGGGNQLGEFFPGPDPDPVPDAGQVAVHHGVFAERLPLAGRTVGEIRRLYGDRFDLPEGAGARIDGRQVDDSAVVAADQVLVFAHEGGEKGSTEQLLLDLLGAAAAEEAEEPGETDHEIRIEGRRVRVTSPEGATAELGLSRVLDELRPPAPDSGGLLPDGTKAVLAMPGGSLVLHQTPPRVFNFRWIAPDSPSPFGPPARYREVRVALPYLLIAAVFKTDNRGRLMPTGKNEAFFANAPLRSMDDELCYPCLLNVSRFEPQEGHPLAWICTAQMDFEPLSHIAGDEQRRAAFLHALLQHVLHGGFNLSSEHHEDSSWFTRTVQARVDPRIESIESWERHTAQDPSFVLEVPWLKTGLSVSGLAQRIRELHFCERGLSALDVARVVTNAGGGQ